MISHPYTDIPQSEVAADPRTRLKRDTKSLRWSFVALIIQALDKTKTSFGFSLDIVCTALLTCI